MRTEVILHSKARKKILAAVNKVSDAVRLSLGPEGASALIHRSFGRGSRITNDGVTIAKCIEPKDEFENLVATAFKEAASKTGEKAGDGTSSTIVIAWKLINSAFALLKDSDNKAGVQIRGMETTGMGVNSLRKHILAAVSQIKAEIAKSTKKIETKEELFNIADVSLAGNKEVAKIVSDMVWEVGVDGFISLGDGFGKIETEVIDGARFPMKIAAPRFLNNPQRFEMVAQDCEAIVTNHRIDTMQDFVDFWNTLKRNKLIIFAPSFSDEVLVQMVKLISPRTMPNGVVTPANMQLFPVKIPSLRTDQLEDLALFCGATFIDKNAGKRLKDIKEEDLGFLEKCTVKSAENREDATLLGGGGSKDIVKLAGRDIGINKVKERIDILKGQKEKTKLPEYKALLDKRIGSLCSKGGSIKVGASTEAEALPLKHKIEDAVFACQNALRHGYVAGGGLCLKEIGEKLFPEDQLIKAALTAPYVQIQENVGGELKFGDEIVDPAKAIEYEVEHGFGVAANLITCKAIIPEVDQNDPRDGYKLISDALLIHAKLFGKKEGLIADGLSEAEAEKLQQQEFLMNQEND